MTKESRHITFFRYFFPLIFVMHFASITLFNHTHVVNGTIIVHSHINTGEHTHSSKSIETIFYLSKVIAPGEFHPLSVPALLSVLLAVLLVPALPDIFIPDIRGAVRIRAPDVMF